MARKLFLLLFLALFAIAGCPFDLAASDEVAVTALNPAKIVETVPLPEPEPEPVSSGMPAAPMTGSYETAVNTVNSTKPVVPVVENYTVTYQVASASEYNALAYNLSYSHIYKYKKMVYGHNSSNLLLSLSYKNVGDIITITENGITSRYQIVWKREMLKISANDLQDTSTGQVYAMKDIAKALDAYDLALETCSGYGDTPYRWVLFANRV